MILFKKFTLCLVITFLSTVNCSFADTNNLKICYEAELQQPFMNGKKQKTRINNTDVLKEILLEAAKDLKLEFTLEAWPWKRCLQELREGRVDGAFSIIWTPERDLWVAFPKTKNGEVDREKSLWDVHYNIFVNENSNLEYKDGKFKNLVHGLDAPPGYIVRERLEQIKAASKTNFTLSQGLGLVATNRIDGYVMEPNSVVDVMEQMQLNFKLKSLKEPFYRDSIFLGLSKSLCQKEAILCHKIWDKIAVTKTKMSPGLRKKYAIK